MKIKNVYNKIHTVQLLWAAFTLALLDGVLTIYGLQTGLVYEANPAMDWLLNKSYLHFFLGRLVLIVPAFYFFYNLHYDRKVRWVATFLVILNLLVFAVHSLWLILF